MEFKLQLQWPSLRVISLSAARGNSIEKRGREYKISEVRKYSYFFCCAFSRFAPHPIPRFREEPGKIIKLLLIFELKILVMDIKATKLELMQLLLQTDEESVLKRVKSILEEESTDWWDDLNEEEIDEIYIGLLQADSGEVIDHEEVRKKFNKWLQK